MKYLITEKVDYANEFDLEAFVVLEAQSEQEIKELVLKDMEFPCELYFGTNECVDYESEEDFLDTLMIEAISEEKAETLISICEGRKFGTAPILGKLICDLLEKDLYQ